MSIMVADRSNRVDDVNYDQIELSLNTIQVKFLTSIDLP